MTLAASPTADLLNGIATEIQAAAIGTYRADGSAYQVGETAVVFDFMPQGTEATPPAPDRVIVLTAYILGDDAGNPWTQYRIQARFRGLPNQPDDVWALRDGFNQLFQSRSATTYGSLTVAQALRVSSIPLGQDDRRRFQISDNYTFDAQLPGTPSRP